ncbi:MAG: hypothetical protein ACRD98_12115 [Nitrososphaera sp.]
MGLQLKPPALSTKKRVKRKREARRPKRVKRPRRKRTDNLGFNVLKGWDFDNKLLEPEIRLKRNA